MRPAELSLPVDPQARLYFRRGDHPGRSLRRKIRVRFHQIVIVILLQAALFAGLQRLWLSLLDWNHFCLSRIEVWPGQTVVGDKVQSAASRFLTANLLALDTSRLASEIKSLPWIKNARIRKVFPSTLRIELAVRIPMAVLDRGLLTLVDGEGVLLAPADVSDTARWPVLKDRGQFGEDYQKKIALARSVLDGLSVELRSRIEGMDLSDIGCLRLRLREDPTELILGSDGFAAKLDIYHRQAARWATLFGRLDAVDLRIADRVYLRRTAGAARTHPAVGRGEVM
jgi:cell division septal protein FtsQ